jgi:hypothetical protein
MVGTALSIKGSAIVCRHEGDPKTFLTTLERKICMRIWRMSDNLNLHFKVAGKVLRLPTCQQTMGDPLMPKAVPTMLHQKYIESNGNYFKRNDRNFKRNDRNFGEVALLQ